MNKQRINRINHYILMSTLIHVLILFATSTRKDVVLGEKVIPVEIIDTLVETGSGEETKRSKKIINRQSINKRSTEEKEDLRSSEIIEPNKDEIQLKHKNKVTNLYENKLIKNTLTKTNENHSKDQKNSGSKYGKKNNEPEKGSLKGIGKIKITCLKCIRPKYPYIALRRGAEGKPVVKVWINTNGKVIKAELTNKSGIKSIDNAAKKAALNSSFYPIDKESTINIEYNLTIR